MPFIGLGLHVLLALFCAVHVIRTGQQIFWLFILFAFPVLGSLVYFFMVYLPNSRLERSVVKAVSAAGQALDPGKALRLARAEHEATPTAQNRMRLAAALLDAGIADEAAQHYAAALQGPFASDPDIRFGAARACVACERFDEALGHLERLRTDRPDYRPEAVTLLHARACAGAGRHADARAGYERALADHGSFEAHAEYAIWALGTGDTALAGRLQAQIDAITARWNAVNRELNTPMLQRLHAAQALARAGSGA
jgi:hypothetical protein